MRFRFNKLALALAAVAGLTGLAGCGGGTGGTNAYAPNDNLAQPLQARYRFVIEFVDARSGDAISDELSVRFAGESVDAGEVRDSNGSSVKGLTYQTGNGMVFAATDFSTRTSFSVVAGNPAKGWITSGVQLRKDASTSGTQQTIRISLVNSGSASAITADPGLALAMTTSASAGVANAGTGTVAAGILVQSPAKTVAGTALGTAQITIPAGTSARDAGGAPASGALSVTVSKFGSDQARSLGAFPGGFLLPSGTSQWLPASFAQFNITDAQGKAIKQFSPAITLRMDLPPGTINPNTGTAVTSGQSYPVWTFDEDNGAWKKETDGTVKNNGSGGLLVEFQASHLSFWMLPFSSPIACFTGGGIAINRSPDAADTRPLDFTITGTGFSASKAAVIDQSLDLYYIPSINPLTVTARTTDGAVVGSQSFSPTELCRPKVGGSYPSAIAVTLPQLPSYSLTVNVTASCPDGSNQAPVATNLYYYPTGQGARAAYSVSSATFTGFNQGTGAGNLLVENPLPTGNDYTETLPNFSGNVTREVNFANRNCSPITGL